MQALFSVYLGQTLEIMLLKVRAKVLIIDHKVIMSNCFIYKVNFGSWTLFGDLCLRGIVMQCHSKVAGSKWPTAPRELHIVLFCRLGTCWNKAVPLHSCYKIGKICQSSRCICTFCPMLGT